MNQLDLLKIIILVELSRQLNYVAFVRAGPDSQTALGSAHSGSTPHSHGPDRM